ncbi:serine/arginine repetitive matrix protein 1-like isoform X1 [Elysia marginata]|uniref:Serine/arginine repetitive matrix protein 1-like isoform X1 n=1 Tax=Elysia marginata TaxID=1093978 RepID=A0AAV4FUH5_9GAST|nr:serine/arginine repetitive matrix protein 1-like isoform X1 [Elysia marginata]
MNFKSSFSPVFLGSPLTFLGLTNVIIAVPSGVPNNHKRALTMYATRQAPKWVPPLPPGWEAKFDPGQHTYFFINHQTRTTQWEDPRFQKRPSPAPTPQPSAAAAAATSLSQSGGKTGSSSARYESLQMRDFGSTSKGGQRQSSQGESSLTNLRAVMLKKLQTEFPAATKELIEDMLTSCQNDEARTRQQLKNLGFGVKPVSDMGRSSLSPSASARGASPTRRTSRGASPARHEQQQPKSTTPTPKREVSEAEKTRIVDQLKREYPNCDPNVVEIASTTCEFDLEQSRELIKAFQKRETEEDRNRGSRGGASSHITTNSVSSQRTQPSQQSLLPAGLSDETSRPVQTGTSHQHRTGHSRGSTSHAGHAGGATRGARGDGAGGGSQPQQARAQQVTRPRHKKTRQTAVVTSQPSVHRPVTESSNRTATVGPNHELRRGPDSSLLMSDYIHAQGPNKDLRHGPDESRIAGPQGCSGPDVTLICGPQHGPLNQQRDRVVTPSAVLVSNL